MISGFLSRSIYRLLSYSLLVPSLIWLIWRSVKEPKYRRSLAERLGWVNLDPSVTGCIWIHAASVGEVMAASPLIDALLTRGPPLNVVLSTNTPTGRDRVAKLWDGRIFCFYAPLDTPDAIRRLLKRLQPTLLLTIEREIWPERFLTCREWGIPTAIVNGRLTERALGQYGRFGSLFNPVWSGIGLVTTPDEASAARFQRLGIPGERLKITGNLKFDIALRQDEAQPSRPATNEGAAAGAIRLVVLGSSHADDEKRAIAGYGQFRRLRQDVVLVIAPRHPARFEQVSKSLREAGLRVHRTATRARPNWADLDVVLIDQMGPLMDWYRQATICIVGGTFGTVGGHNPLEPLQAKKPILFGPSQENAEQLFQEIAADGSGIPIPGGASLWDIIDRLLLAPEELAAMARKAEAFVAQKKGAAQKTLLTLESRWAERMRNSAPAIVKINQDPDVLWLDPEVAMNQQIKEPSAFSWEHNPFFSRALDQGGRGQAFFVQIDKVRGLFRHYRRGGLLGRFIRDTYLGGSSSASRAMREFLLLRRARLWELPVPRPLAAHCQRLGGFRYKANLITEEIIGAQPLGALLQTRRLSLAAWHRIGTVLRTMHSHQIFHADLNCHNLLIDPDEKVWVIDFDKSAVCPGDQWKADNLARLYRSLRKQESLSEDFHYLDEDWQSLLKAYSAQPQ